MVEPGASKIEPYPTNIPTLITTPPDTIRYKYFARNGAVEYYMPTYTLEELLSIGEYLRSENRVPEETRHLYNPEEIEKSFSKCSK